MAIPLGDPERARTVTLTVSSAVFARIVEHARKAHVTPGEYVLAMFEKGCATGGDRDAAIARLQEDLSAARKAEGALRATLASRDWELKQAATITMSAPDSGDRISRLEQERDAARSEAATLRRKAEEAGRLTNDLKICASALRQEEAEVGVLRREALATEEAIAALRVQLAEMTERAEGLRPPSVAKGIAPRGHRDMVDRGRDEAPTTDAEPLTPAFVKSVVGFRCVGNGPRDIARLMRCDVAQVRRALEAR